MRTVSPSPKQVLGAFCEKCASQRGTRPAYSLPLAWHEINCCLALRAPEGRTIPAPLRVLLPWLPSTPRWPVRTKVTDRRPQGQAVALDLPAAQELTVLSCRGYCQRDAGSGDGEIGARLESSHQTLLLEQCSAQLAVPACRPPRATGK